MRPLLHAALAIACLAAGLGLPSATRAATPVKVAVIVGPVGDLTPTYLALAETAAATAERHGASVARAYSPNATPANVLAAVADANVVIYFGHGYGHPSPYGGLDTARQNGWGLQGPRARGTHDDGLNGYLAYYGEDWIIANARPAPGFVMIYSNTCYAPGASEGGFAPATPTVAAERVAYYSRKVFAMGGSAYFATDFDRGAADLVDGILSNRGATYGAIFAGDHRYVPAALTTQAHPFSAGQQIWLHRTKYTDGPPNYWYAFAGDPTATPMRSWDPVAPRASLDRPETRRDVAPWTSPRVRFSEPVVGVDPTTLRLLGPDGSVVPAHVVHEPGSRSARLVPVDALALGTPHTVVVGPGIVDLAGNALAPRRWTFMTRLDADPLAAPLSVTLAEGRHRLIRLDVDGSTEERRVVDLAGDRRVDAGTRARLPGRAGSWFRLDTGRFAGWWVAESPRARADGEVEQVVLPPTEVRLDIPADPDAASVEEGEIAAVRDVVVDRRAVLDGRTYLRVAAGLPGQRGRWVEAPADALPAELVVDRVLERRKRDERADLVLVRGTHVAYRFNRAGQVIERQTIRAADQPDLDSVRTLDIAGRRFHVVDGGALDGWAIADDERVSVSIPAPRDPS